MSEMKEIGFIPLYDRVLILPLEGVREIEGVILPDSSREDQKYGIVVSIGIGYMNESGTVVRPLVVQPGNKVVFGPFAGLPIVIEGQEFLSMREAEIMGILPNK